MEVKTSPDKIYAYEKTRPNNKITHKVWTVLTDTNDYLYGGFIKRRHREDKLDTAFIPSMAATA